MMIKAKSLLYLTKWEICSSCPKGWEKSQILTFVKLAALGPAVYQEEEDKSKG